MNVPKLRFKDDNGLDFPEGVHGFFGDMAEIIMGQSPSGDTYNQEGVGIALINGPTEFTERYPKKIQWTSAPTKLCKKGDILFCVRGSSTGRINISNDEYCIGRGIAAIRGKFLHHTGYIERLLLVIVPKILALTSGSTFPSVDGQSLKNIDVYIPSLPEQTKIANFLSAVDDKIAELTKKVALLQRYKKGAMQQIFSQQLRFKDDNGQDFPEWEEKTLGDMSLKVGSGSTPLGGEKVYQSFGIPFIRSQNVNNDRLVLDDVAYISEEINVQMRNSIVKSNDILLNITGASIGRSCVVPSNFQTGNVNQHVCIIRLQENYSPQFVQCFLTSENGQKLISYNQVGSGREGLNFQEIRKFKLFIPSFKEQTKIANFLSALDEQINTSQQQLNLSKQYKQSLLQQMFI